MEFQVNAGVRCNPHGGRRPERTLLCGRNAIGEEKRFYGAAPDDEIFLYRELGGGFEVWKYGRGAGLVQDVLGERLFKPDTAQAREFFNSCETVNQFAQFPE